LKVTDEKSKIRIRIRSVSQSYRSAYPDPDLDPYQNVTDPEHRTTIQYLLFYGAVRNGFKAVKIHYKGHWKGWALEIETFLGPEMATSEAQKKSSFQKFIFLLTLTGLELTSVDLRGLCSLLGLTGTSISSVTFFKRRDISP
jgi:hypothetical protein